MASPALPSSPPAADTEMDTVSELPQLDSLSMPARRPGDRFAGLSSDEITSINFSAAEPHRLLKRPSIVDSAAQSRKANRTATSASPATGSAVDHGDPPQNFISTQPRTAKDALREARDLIIEASRLAITDKEQDGILDLLTLFREYTESGEIKKISSILASNINELNLVSKQIETKTRALKQAKPTAKPTFADIAAAAVSAPAAQISNLADRINRISSSHVNNLLPPPTTAGKIPRTQEQEFTVVGRKGKSAKQAPSSARAVKPTKQADRVVLIGASAAESSPMQLRNAINYVFEKNGVSDPVVKLVEKSLGGNIVLTTTPQFSAAFLVEKEALWKPAVQYKAIQVDEPWYKVIVHGLSLTEFNIPEGMNLLKREIYNFNGLEVVGTPYWLSNINNLREHQHYGSAVVAFKTELEANKAIRNRLDVAGASLRVDKLLSTPKSTQCRNCQGFGHLQSYCKKAAVCCICGGEHNTAVHSCNTCPAKGAECLHTIKKCANCKEPHTANTRTCEFFRAARTPRNRGEPTSSTGAGGFADSTINDGSNWR